MACEFDLIDRILVSRLWRCVGGKHHDLDSICTLISQKPSLKVMLDVSECVHGASWSCLVQFPNVMAIAAVVIVAVSIMVVDKGCS